MVHTEQVDVFFFLRQLLHNPLKVFLLGHIARSQGSDRAARRIMALFCILQRFDSCRLSKTSIHSSDSGFALTSASDVHLGACELRQLFNRTTMIAT